MYLIISLLQGVRYSSADMHKICIWTLAVASLFLTNDARGHYHTYGVCAGTRYSIADSLCCDQRIRPKNCDTMTCCGYIIYIFLFRDLEVFGFTSR